MNNEDLNTSRQAGLASVKKQMPINLIMLKCPLKRLHKSVLLAALILLQIAIAVPARAQALFTETFEYGVPAGGTNISNPFPSDPYNNSATCMRVAASGTSQIHFSGITVSSNQNLQLTMQVDTATAGTAFYMRAALFSATFTGNLNNGYGIYIDAAGGYQIAKYNQMGLWQNPPTVLVAGTNKAVFTTNGWNRLLFTWATNGALSFSINGTNVLMTTDTQFAPGVMAANGLGIMSWNNNANLAFDNIQITSLPAVPNGAADAGYTQCVINEYPVATDIAPGNSGNFKWFTQLFCATSRPPVTNYTTTSGAQGTLRMCLNSAIYSAPPDMSASALPVLSGSNGFYVEYRVKYSDTTNADHFQAVWLEALEHCTHPFTDHYSGDPDGYERFMELDVDEGGWGNPLSTLTTVHSWAGIWSTNPLLSFADHKNTHQIWTNALDRTQWHTHGASYNPTTSRVKWWLDGTNIFTTTNSVPAIAKQQHFYLLLDSASHGLNAPYTMDVGAVRAYVPPNVPTNIYVPRGVPNLLPGNPATFQLTVFGDYSAGGSGVNITISNGISFTSSDTNIFTVNGNGVVKPGQASGTAGIIINYQGLSLTQAVTCLAPTSVRVVASPSVENTGTTLANAQASILATFNGIAYDISAFDGVAFVDQGSPVASISSTGAIAPTGIAGAMPVGATYLGVAYVTPNVFTVVSASPANLTAVLSGGLLRFSWPADHLGWSLQEQISTLGIGTNWIDVPGATSVTSMNIPLNLSAGAVFYRMVFP